MESDLQNGITVETKTDRPYYRQPDYLRHNLLVGIKMLAQGCELTFTPVNKSLQPLGDLGDERGDSHYDWSQTTGYLLKAKRIAEPKNQPIDSMKLKKIWLEALRTMDIIPALTPGVGHDSIQRMGDSIWINNSVLDAIQKKWDEPIRITEKEVERIEHMDSIERDTALCANRRIHRFIADLSQGLSGKQEVTR